MNILIYVTRITVYPFVRVILYITNVFIMFAKKREIASNCKNAEDKLTIEVLYILFLTTLGLAPMIPSVFIQNTSLFTFCVLVTSVSLPYAIICGWSWIKNFNKG